MAGMTRPGFSCHIDFVRSGGQRLAAPQPKLNTILQNQCLSCSRVRKQEVFAGATFQSMMLLLMTDFLPCGI
jgi:hypothetical protein